MEEKEIPPLIPKPIKKALWQSIKSIFYLVPIFIVVLIVGNIFDYLFVDLLYMDDEYLLYRILNFVFLSVSMSFVIAFVLHPFVTLITSSLIVAFAFYKFPNKMGNYKGALLHLVIWLSFGWFIPLLMIFESGHANPQLILN